MNNSFDIIIIGAGAFGSSAAYHLSKTSCNVLVLDKHHPPHSFGSSHGKTRIIREAYFEDPSYVPLLREAYKLWTELEKRSGKHLFLKTGGLMLGTGESHVIQGTIKSALTYDIDHEIIDHNDIKRRFSCFMPDHDTIGVIEQQAGILFPERCIETALELAKGNGVQLNFNESVISIFEKKGLTEIITDKGQYITKKCIVASGPWMTKVLPELRLLLKTTRQVLFWYDVKKGTEHFQLSKTIPVFIWNTTNGKHFYGFPDTGDGFKIAFHDKGSECDPDNLNKIVSKAEIEEMNETINKHFTFQAIYRDSSVCMYTNTPDDHFIIDHYPGNRNIIIASPCSGHGFKFSSVIGRILAELALENKIEYDMGLFNLKRFS